MKKHSKVIWAAVAFLLALLTMRLVFAGSGMTAAELTEGIREASPLYLAMSAVCMLGIIIFEGEALILICRKVGCRRSHLSGALYSAADIYFSAITPSATGGQPGSAFFMMKDGISAPVTAAALLVNLMMYTVSLVFCGVVSILLQPALILKFQPGSRVLIAVGLLVIFAQVIAFWFALKKPALLSALMRGIVGFLHRIRLVRHPEKWIEKLDRMLEEYDECVKMLSGKGKVLWLAFFLNVMQRISQFAGVAFVCRAFGGSWRDSLRLGIMQCMIYIGVYCVPIPGSIGAADYLMLDGYISVMEHDMAYKVQMIGRGMSFYCCTAISAVIVLTGFLALKGRKKEKHRV